MSGDRVNVVKERSRAFLELAKDLLEKGRTDIASFNVHQASQLRVKAALLRLVGETPRVHGLRELLGMLAKRLEELNYSDLSNKIVSFVRRRRDHLIDVETAYVESRYGIAEETIENLRMMINVAEELFAILDQVEKDVLG